MPLFRHSSATAPSTASVWPAGGSLSGEYLSVAFSFVRTGSDSDALVSDSGALVSDSDTQIIEMGPKSVTENGLSELKLF